MTFGSLFAGIGGMDLGLERAGFNCSWQVEFEAWRRQELARHWPDVRRHDDVRTFPPNPLEDWSVDLICGGFPCQDLSFAGLGAGLDGERSGLWREQHRIIGLLRPRFAVVENSPALLHRGIGRVLGDLAEIGFDAEWSVVSACSLGAPHPRERLFIVAYSDQELRETGLGLGQYPEGPGPSEPDLLRERQERWLDAISRADRGFDGIPDRMDRLAGLGDAVSPPVAEWIGRRLMTAMEAPHA